MLSTFSHVTSAQCMNQSNVVFTYRGYLRLIEALKEKVPGKKGIVSLPQHIRLVGGLLNFCCIKGTESCEGTILFRVDVQEIPRGGQNGGFIFLASLRRHTEKAG